MPPARELRPKLHSDRQGAAAPPPPVVPSFDKSSMESTFASLWRSSGLSDWADEQDRLDKVRSPPGSSYQRQLGPHARHQRPRESHTNHQRLGGSHTSHQLPRDTHANHQRPREETSRPREAFRNGKSSDCRVAKAHARHDSSASSGSRSSSMRIEAIVDDHPSPESTCTSTSTSTSSRAASPAHYPSRYEGEALPPIHVLHPHLHQPPLHPFRNTPEVSI